MGPTNAPREGLPSRRLHWFIRPSSISVTPSIQVYELPDDGSQGSEYEGDGVDGEMQDEDIPQGLPPLPTPASGPPHPQSQRLQRTRHAPTASQGNGGLGAEARDGRQPARFVHGSRLEGPSLCSSVLEDVVLEERMAEVMTALMDDSYDARHVARGRRPHPCREKASRAPVGVVSV